MKFLSNSCIIRLITYKFIPHLDHVEDTFDFHKSPQLLCVLCLGAGAVAVCGALATVVHRSFNFTATVKLTSRWPFSMVLCCYFIEVT